MTADPVRHLLLTGVKRGRARITGALRGTPVWHPLRAAYRAVSPLWRNALVRAALLPLRRRLYVADLEGYWRREGRSYMQDEAALLGPGSLTERQGEFLAAEIEALGARSVLEVGCGYESQLATAGEYLRASRVPLVLADATRGLPFRDSAFDVVYTQGSLMHVPRVLGRAYRSEVARVARRYVIHTEDARETEITFAHDNEGHYRELGRRPVKKVPYPFNLPGQGMTFEVFERAEGSRR